MPKRVMLLFTVFSFALAVTACKNGSNAVPTPAPSVSFTPIPTDHKATIQVTILGTPAPKIPVEESTPASKSSPRPGTPFVTQTTGKQGKTIFTGLDPKGTYCWVAVLGAGQTSSSCGDFTLWQTGTVTLGT